MTTLIIPTKEREAILIESLEAIEVLVEKYNLEVIIINDSKIQNLNLIKKRFNFVCIYDNPKNGVASARNLGISKSTNEMIIFMDDDIIITEEALISSIEFYNNNKNSSLNVNWVYPKKLFLECLKTKFGRYLIHYEFDSLKGWRKNDIWDDEKSFRVNGGASYFLVIGKSTFNKIGGYNENFPFSGYEDAEFNKRLHNKNIEIYIDPKVFVYHNEIDKTKLDIWLVKKLNSYKTKKIAKELGHEDAELNFSNAKILFYSILTPFRKVLYFIYYLIPNHNFFDKLSFNLIDRMHGISSFRGYYLK